MNWKAVMLFLLVAVIGIAVNPTAGCTKEKCLVVHQTLGCYKDSKQSRVLPDYIYNERDPTMNNYGGRKADWKNWRSYMPGFICRCAEKAKKLGYDLFGIQFYGECWAGKSGQHNFAKLGAAKTCVNVYHKQCTAFDRYCVGEKLTNMVYRIVDSGSCPCAPFEKVGCFKDAHKKQRPLPSYILNDRDVKHKHFSGKRIDWRNWDTYVPDLACRCAKKAKENGWSVFGLQFYGECWGGDNGQNTYSIDGPSSKCTDNCYKPCDNVASDFCVGQHNANFVYRLSTRFINN